MKMGELLRKRGVDEAWLGWVSIRSNLYTVRPGQSILFDIQLLSTPLI